MTPIKLLIILSLVIFAYFYILNILFHTQDTDRTLVIPPRTEAPQVNPSTYLIVTATPSGEVK